MGERSYASADILVCRRQELNTLCTLLSYGAPARAPRAGVRDGLEDEAAGRGDWTGGGHTGDGWSSRGLFSAWECSAVAVGLLAVHDLMSEAEVSGMVIKHTSCRVLLFTVLMDVNEGITLFSLALRKCNSTISTMLPAITSNAEQMGTWYA